MVSVTPFTTAYCCDAAIVRHGRQNAFAPATVVRMLLEVTVTRSAPLALAASRLVHLTRAIMFLDERPARGQARLCPVSVQ